MLNIDDRLIKEVLPVIKPNAFSVLLAIAIHLNKQTGRCFPSNERLCKLTGLGRDSVYAALKTLRENGLLESHQSIDSKSKTFGQRTFKVTTRFISIFVTAQDAEPLPEMPYTADPYTAEPDTANQETQRLNEFERLNNLELINEVGESAPAPPVENQHTSQPNKPDLTMPAGGGADGGLTYSDRPRPKDANDLKEKLRNYFVANPTQWVDYVLENGKARNWPEEKIADTVTAYCLNKQKNSDFQRTYHEYTADLTTWFLRQPSFDTKKPAETGAATKLHPSPYKRLTA